MSACDENDPVPCKTKVELDAEETEAEKLSDENARHPMVRWGAVVIGALVVILGVVRWLFGP